MDPQAAWIFIQYVALSAGAAGIRALLGYLKSKEDMDYSKALYTLLYGIAIGGAAAAFGISENVAVILLTGLGATVALEDASKGLWRRIKSHLDKCEKAHKYLNLFVDGIRRVLREQ